MNKRLCINLLLVAISFFANGSALIPQNNNLFNIIWEKCDSRVGKRKEIAAMVLETFDGIIPKSERREWREDVGRLGIDVDDLGCCREWHRQNEYDNKEQVTVIFELEACKDEKRQVADIDEAIDGRIKQAEFKYKHVTSRVEKINDCDAILELDICDSAMKKLCRILFLDKKWLIEMAYVWPTSTLKEKNIDFGWENKRDMWVSRFQSVQFN